MDASLFIPLCGPSPFLPLGCGALPVAGSCHVSCMRICQMHDEGRWSDHSSLPCLFCFLSSAGLFAPRCFPDCFPSRILGAVRVAEVAIQLPSHDRNPGIASLPPAAPHGVLLHCNTPTPCSLSQQLIATYHHQQTRSEEYELGAGRRGRSG